ncbi:expressed unknown protein [Seminavis robusta]|uniref:SET domain-containing protein n=1 Tax=Seminavis robusta TaxID=568900 RepID=A0A9N8E5Z8_9STRA|nr:expressed unknown protein [Seminavis robusta]|eukprot:Sro585_g170980.1 n/a (324) ;mRNA; r:21127-22098
MALLLLAILLLLSAEYNLAYVPFSLSSGRQWSSSQLASDATDNNNNHNVIADCLLRGVNIMDAVMTSEFMHSSPSLKTMYSQMIKNVEIKQSSIPDAGLGLFAKKNIKAGTIVSFYPAHALGVDNDDQCLFVQAPQDADYFRDHPSSDSCYLHCTDQPLFRRTSLLQQQLANDNDMPLYLDVNPHRKPIVDGWVSQFINDGAVVQSNSEEGVLDYYEATGRAKNCIHIPWGPSPVMATVTTRKVKKGQELFTSYGSTYWLGVLLGIHGTQGVGITPPIQAKIQETARDLLASMQAVSVTYDQQAQAMQQEFDKVADAVGAVRE